MGDLNTPPPSYESAMGIPGSSHRTQPYFPISSAPPLPDDDIVSAPITTPIIPQTTRQSNIRPTPLSRIQPEYTSHVYTTNRPPPPPPPINQRVDQRSSENDNKACSCVFIILILLSGLVYVFVKVARAGSMKTNNSSPSYTSYRDNSYSYSGNSYSSNGYYG